MTGSHAKGRQRGITCTWAENKAHSYLHADQASWAQMESGGRLVATRNRYFIRVQQEHNYSTVVQRSGAPHHVRFQ
jgi:hypothetical protein